MRSIDPSRIPPRFRESLPDRSRRLSRRLFETRRASPPPRGFEPRRPPSLPERFRGKSSLSHQVFHQRRVRVAFFVPDADDADARGEPPRIRRIVARVVDDSDRVGEFRREPSRANGRARRREARERRSFHRVHRRERANRRTIAAKIGTLLQPFASFLASASVSESNASHSSARWSHGTSSLAE